MKMQSPSICVRIADTADLFAAFMGYSRHTHTTDERIIFVVVVAFVHSLLS